jgi:glycosyltransferase involved in cell wall biosynthesis
MRIININKFHYARGGSEQYFFFLERALRRRGWEVIPFAMQHPQNRPTPFEVYFPKNVDYFAGSFLSRLVAATNVVYSAGVRRCLAHLLDDTNPSIAHVHLFQQQLSLAILPELAGRHIPIVHTVHDLKPICPNYKMLTHDGLCERCLGRRFYNCTLHRCVRGSVFGSLLATVEMYAAHFGGYLDLIDYFLTPSRWYGEKLVEGGIPAHKVRVLPLICDLDAYTPSYDDGGYFVFAGRLAEEKGVATLLKAMKRVGRQPLLKVAGTGPLEQQLKDEAARLGLHNVQFVGFRSGHELLSLLAGAMFVVVPSEWYENSPVAIYEAMALGKPVVASRIGGIPELIVEGETGFLFEAGNAEELAQQIARLADDPALRERLGREARHRGETIYAPATHMDRLLSIYADCASAGQTWMRDASQFV